MTKNKSLFSGVGDGNRVKSIRLQGDKHTQGKKGEEKNCECGQGGSEPRAPADLPGPAACARDGVGEGRGGGKAQGQPRDQWPSGKTKPEPGQLARAEAATGAEWP